MAGQTPNSERQPLALRIVRAIVFVLAAVQLALYAQLALRTLNYPFPLEWMEGGTVDVVERVLKEEPIYTRPTAGYVPYIYPPLYYWISAQASRAIGIGFLAPRLVSFASVCAIFALIAAIVRRGGGDSIDALAGAAMFAGTYETTERWFHLARVDSLLLALLLAAAFVLQAGAGRWSAVAAGALLFLACLTKQTALLAAVPLLAIGALRDPQRPIVAGVVLAVLVIATSVWMNARTDGWWMYFLYRLPQMHPLAIHGSRWFWRYDMIPVLPCALAVSALWFGTSLASGDLRPRWIAALCVGGVVASWSARLHSGGAANSLMPAYAALAVTMPVAVAAFRTRPWLHLAGTTLIALQLALLLHTWTGVVPTAADLEAGRRYLNFVGGIHGEVMVWHQRFVETLAHKRSWGLEMAAEDVLRADDPVMRDELQADVIRACRHGEVVGVIDPPEWLRQAVAFDPPVDLFDDPTVFRPVSGAAKRPERYFAIATATMHQPDQTADHAQVETDAQQAERTASK